MIHLKESDKTVTKIMFVVVGKKVVSLEDRFLILNKACSFPYSHHIDESKLNDCSESTVSHILGDYFH